MAELLCLYEICEVVVASNPEESFFDFGDQAPKVKTSYQFVLRHVINYDKSQLFQHFYTIGVDPIAYYRKNVS
jgi:hypothetical protein